MTVNDINLKSKKLPKSKGFFKVLVGGNEYRYFFVRDCKITYDDSNVQVDNPGITPIFTRLTDEVGSFEFTLGNTLDIYAESDSDKDKAKVWLCTNWQEGIRKTEFSEITFVRESALHKFPADESEKKRILSQHKLRIKSCGGNYSQDEAIDDVIVSGAVLDDENSIAIQAV